MISDNKSNKKNMQNQKLNTQALRLIFVTDIHLSEQNLIKLENWYITSKLSFDYCLCGGDIANCNQNQLTHNEQQMQIQANNVLFKLRDIFKCKILYIPGNHDPLDYFNNNKVLAEGVENVHNKSILLADGLSLICCGGSVPGYYDKQFAELIWQGYPFSNNHQLQEQLKKSSIFEQNPSKNQTIIMTHVGPFQSQTTVVKSNKQKIIYSGATSFDKLLNFENLILYLHGHTHDGSKYQRINRKPIINPGPLVYGQFCHFYLSRVESAWRVKQTHFIQL